MSIRQDHCSRTGEAPLYVLGELQGAELDAFARHLQRCEECAEEVGLLQQAADAVPYLGSPSILLEEEKEPPAQRVTTPTLAFAAATAREARIAAQSDAEWQPPAQTGRPVLRTIQGGASRTREQSGAPKRRLLKTPVPRSGLAAFLALAVLAIVTVALSGEGASLRYYRISAGWLHGGAALKLEGNQLQLLVDTMPKPPKGEGYQVWVMNRSDKTLTPTSSWIRLNLLGQAGVNVSGDYHQWAAIAVYTEPLTGPYTTRSGAAVVGDLRRLG